MTCYVISPETVNRGLKLLGAVKLGRKLATRQKTQILVINFYKQGVFSKFFFFKLYITFKNVFTQNNDSNISTQGIKTGYIRTGKQIRREK